MSDRHEQARAEAERRVRDLENRNIYGPANSVGYLVGHAEGVEWADANPKPHTIKDVCPHTQRGVTWAEGNTTAYACETCEHEWTETN